MGQEIPVATWEESRVLCFPSRWGLTSGESGMQPRDPCCPWRGTLCPGQKPRWGLFCPTVTREQHPSLPRNSNGRLVFTGPTQEEVWISRCNSRIPPQLLKTRWFPIHRNMRPLPATESQEKSHVSSSSSKCYLARLMRPQKFPHIPVSLQGNTEVPGTTSFEPLLPLKWQF